MSTNLSLPYKVWRVLEDGFVNSFASEKEAMEFCKAQNDAMFSHFEELSQIAEVEPWNRDAFDRAGQERTLRGYFTYSGPCAGALN